MKDDVQKQDDEATKGKIAYQVLLQLPHPLHHPLQDKQQHAAHKRHDESWAAGNKRTNEIADEVTRNVPTWT